MAQADDEMMEAIKGLEDAGAAVNATKPVKPIRVTRKGKKVTPIEYNPNDGVVTFAEDEGPFKAPTEVKVIAEGVEEALDACGVGYVPEEDTPNEAGPGPLADFEYHDEPQDADATKVMLIRKYAAATHSIYTTSPGTPQEKTFGTQSLWSYVIALNNCFVRVLKLSEVHRGSSKDMAIETDVYCSAELVEKHTGEKVTMTVMCASTDEEFIAAQKNKLSAAYGLAQTRAEERLARMTFGYQVALAGLQPTPAEELDVVEKWWGTKDKEL